MAGALIGALRVTLGIDTAAFEEGLGIAQKRLNAAGRNLQQIGDRMSGLGKTLSIGVTAPLVAFGATAVQAANESSAALAQVNAALESMGPVAGKSSEQLQKAAADLQKISTFDDDDILKSVTANMLTFGNVAGEQFDRAQLAAVNLSARLGQDLQSSALQLGKALNDPVKGLTALGRVGIQFTSDQKAMIKEMVAAGDVAGAQGIILGELEKQFGGAAKAARDAAPGSDTVDAWREFQETVGAIIVDVLPKLTDFLTGVLEKFNNLSPSTQSFVVAAAAIAAALGPVLMGLGSLVSIVGAVIPAFAPLVAVISGAFGAGGVFAGAFTSVSAFGSMLSLIGAAIAPVLAPLAAVAAVGALIWANWDKISPVLTKLQERFTTTLGPKLTGLVNTVKTVLTELWNGPLGQAVRVVIGVLGELAAVVTTVLGEIFVRVASALVTVIQNAFTIIGDIFRILGALLSGDFSAAWEGVKTLVGDVVNGWLEVMKSLAPEAVAAVSNMVKGIQDWIGQRLTKIWDAAKAKIEAVKKWFFDLYDAVVGNSYIPDMVDEIGQNMARLEKQMVEPAKRTTKAVKEAFRTLSGEVLQILDRLFPAQAQIRSILADMAKLDEALSAKAISPEAFAAAKAALELDLRAAQGEAAGRVSEKDIRALADQHLPAEASARKLAEDAAVLRAAIASGEGDTALYARALAAIDAEMQKAKDWPLKDELGQLVAGLLPAQAQLAETRKQFALLDQALATGNIDPETYRQAAAALREELDVAEEAVRRAEMMTTEMGRALIGIGDFGRDVGTSIMDALHAGIEGKGVFAALKESFTNVLKNVSHSALTALEKSIFGENGLAGALENLFQNLFRKLFPQTGTDASGGIGGLLGSVLGRLFDDVPGFALGGSFTVGGRPGRDRNLVAFRATRGEKVSISHDEATSGAAGFLAGGGRAVTINQNLTFSGAVDLATREEVYRVAEASRQAAISAIRQADRRAG